MVNSHWLSAQKIYINSSLQSLEQKCLTFKKWVRFLRYKLHTLKPFQSKAQIFSHLLH